MNIIKLQDRLMPEGCEKSTFFNTYLKGKYAYWIHMRYVVPIETMSYNAYVACEEDINKLLKNDDGEYPRPYGCEYLDLYEHIIDLYDNRELNILDYIDSTETDRVNNINEFILRNEFITSADLTLDDIKRFRTWLAENLLLLDTDLETGEYKNFLYNSQEIHVLQYYKAGMIDSVIRGLMDFGHDLIRYNSNPNTSNCGCSHLSDLSSLYNTSISGGCDTINIYKKNIYNKMVDMFSSADFWSRLPKEFILKFKQYIDNIIKLGMPLPSSSYVAKYVDCNCTNSIDKTEGNIILEKLSESLEHIYNEETTKYKNYINKALKGWASTLYEQMYW